MQDVYYSDNEFESVSSDDCLLISSENGNKYNGQQHWYEVHRYPEWEPQVVDADALVGSSSAAALPPDTTSSAEVMGEEEVEHKVSRYESILEKSPSLKIRCSITDTKTRVFRRRLRHQCVHASAEGWAQRIKKRQRLWKNWETS